VLKNEAPRPEISVDRIADFVSSMVPCESCAISVLDGEALLPRASNNPQGDGSLSVPVMRRGRVVAVINLQQRYPREFSRMEIDLVTIAGLLVGAEIELARLESENRQLSELLETRKVLDRAKGILQRDLGISEEEAYLTIQRQSRQRRRSKREIAEAILLADDVHRGAES